MGRAAGRRWGTLPAPISLFRDSQARRWQVGDTPRPEPGALPQGEQGTVLWMPRRLEADDALSAIWATSPACSRLVGMARLIAVVWHSVLRTGIVLSASLRGGSQPAAAARCHPLALMTVIVFVVGGGERGPLSLTLAAY